MKTFFTFIIALLVSLQLASATTYYVNASSGNDSNDGSSGSPWLTLYNSIPKLSAGDTLLCTGVFSEAPGYGSSRTVAGGGANGNPITIKANGLAVINLQDNSGDDCTYNLTGDNIVIDGFAFTSTLATGVAYGGFISFNGSNCVMKNLVVTNCFGSHEAAAGNADHLWCFQSRGNYNIFTNIYFAQVNDADLFRIHGRNHLITSIVASNCLNLWYDWTGSSCLHADIVQIGMFQGDGDTRSNILENCTFINHDDDTGKMGPSGGIYQAGYGGSQVTNNLFWSHWTFRNNVFINWGQGFQMENYTNHFYNNIFFNTCTNYQNPPASIYFGSGGFGDGVGSILLNNVWVASGGLTIYTPPVTVSYNAWDALTFGRMSGGGWSEGISNNLVTLSQMGFVNATNYPYDLHLLSTSILRGKGVNLTSDASATTTDKDGITRPASAAWDVGPYQYGTNIISTYYAAPDGLESNTGITTNSPWPLDYALVNMGASNTIMLMDGLYAQHPANWAWFITQPYQTIKAINKWGPRFYNLPITNGGGVFEVLISGNGDGATIDGLAFSNCQYAAVSIRKVGATNCTIRNLWVQHTGQTFPASQGASGVATMPGMGLLVEQCLLEWNGTNVSKIGFNHGIYGGGTNGVYRNNVCRYNGGYGIVIGSHGDTDRNNRVYNNVLYGNITGNPADDQLALYNDQATPPSSSSWTNYFYGNTIISRGAYAVICQNGMILFTNNIILSTNDGVHRFDSYTSDIIAGNYNVAHHALRYSGPSDVVTNYFGFVNTNSGLYWIKSDSPARGTALSTVCGPVDFFGVTQATVTDIGAFQYSANLTNDVRILDPSPSGGANYWASITNAPTPTIYLYQFNGPMSGGGIHL